MNQIHPKKLLNSKWTAMTAQHQEKHFLISKVEFNQQGAITTCTLEAIISNKEYLIDWRELKNSAKWQQGWH